MNTKFTLLVITGSLLVAAPFLPAQTINPNTNSLPLVQTVKYQAARHQLQQEWAGLQRYRADSVGQIRPLLTPDQIAILDDPKNQWRENHGAEANDPSSN